MLCGRRGRRGGAGVRHVDVTSDGAAQGLATARENRRCARVLARSLCREQGTHVVISPGSRSAPLALAFDELPAAIVHVVLDERAAGFVALGIARRTGEPAIAMCSSGSAGANYFPAVVEANLGRVPLLVITANRPAELHGTGSPQTMPQRALFGEHARASISLPEPCASVSDRQLRNLAERARNLAVGSPAGPVHLDVPFREPLYLPELEDEAERTELPRARTVMGRSMLADADLDMLAQQLAQEPRGLIVAGPITPALAAEGTFADAVAKLATKLGWPIIADPLSGLRWPVSTELERAPAIAHADLLVSAAEFARVMQATRVLRFGQLPTSKALNAFLAGSGVDRVTLVDGDGAWLDGGGVADRLVVAEPAALCRGLVERLDAHRPLAEGRAYRRAWAQAEEIAGRALAAACESGDSEGRAARELVRALPDGTSLFVGSSMPIRDLDRFGGASARRVHVAANRGVNGIDGAIATALGMALARRTPTVAWVGDLTFLHDLDGCESAASLGARMTIVVVNNGGGGLFERLPIARHPSAFERLFLTPRPANLGGIARALGMTHTRITRVDELAMAVLDDLERPGVGVVELSVDRRASLAHSQAALASVEAALSREWSASGAPMATSNERGTEQHE
ncbi:MAG: 2-succinyl-5-enolpyruvyl-6-hydroxy-3-cyclohexene-1-carboxylic-acid synthase [Myxococcales bacterium]|nr:2-succinyl-5-enolpyruvyl-6-hydroxy-3-cyclohexene-1-carboxylic-acid synthase [Myxococcales bacterium]